MKTQQTYRSQEQIISNNKSLVLRTQNTFYKPPSNQLSIEKRNNKNRKGSHILGTMNSQTSVKYKPLKKQSISSQSCTKLASNKNPFINSKNDNLNKFSNKNLLKLINTSPDISLRTKIQHKFSTYALSTISSFAKSFKLNSQTQLIPHQNSPIKSPKSNQQNTNPQQHSEKQINQLQKSQLNKQKLVGPKKIKNDLIKPHTVQSLMNKKLMTEGNEQWENKCLRKRISSFSKISHKIKQMSEIFRTEDMHKLQNKILSQNHYSQDNLGIDQIQGKRYLNKQQAIKKIQDQLIQTQKPNAIPIISPENRSKSLHNFPHCANGNYRNIKSDTETKSQVGNAKDTKMNLNRLAPQDNNDQKSKSTTKYHRTLKLHTQTVYSHFQKHKSKSINTLSQFQDSLLRSHTGNVIIQFIDSITQKETSIIKQIRMNRSTNKLQKQPKQWQYYNFLNLNRIQLYQTNLRISSESWLALDYLQLKFLRGWNVKQTKDYSLIGVRLLLVKLLQNMVKCYGLQLDKIKLRIHYKNLKHRIPMPQRKRGKITKDQEQGYTLRNHTILSVESLVIGMCRVVECEDLIMSLVYVVGYLLVYLQEQKDKNKQNISESLYNQTIYFKQNSSLHYYIQTFINQSQMIFQQLKLQSIQLADRQHKSHLILFSHSLDISVLFMSCLTYQLFQGIVLGNIPNDVTVRYQVGWNHWEGRVHHFRNQFKILEAMGLFGFKDQQLRDTAIQKVKISKEENLIVYNPLKKIIIVIAAAKINMGTNDLVSIDKWISKTFKRFFKQKI